MRRDNLFDWDLLLNGELHTVNLAAFNGGVNDFRALAYREADRRKRTIRTHKLSIQQVEVQAFGAGLNGCTCDAPPGRRHMITCDLMEAERLKQQAAANAAMWADLHAEAQATPPPAQQDPDPALGDRAA